MSHWREVDGFQLFSGIAALVTGPVMLAMGAPAGWAFIVMTTGTLVLLAQWVLVSEITFSTPDAATIALVAAGILVAGIAVVYLTRAANDLPTLFPGYDPSDFAVTLPEEVKLIFQPALHACGSRK